MTLALVIPVRNDQQNLDRLLAQARSMVLFDQVVVVDDASDTPVTVTGDTIGPRLCPITVLRRETPGGAGAARNAGLTLVQTDHMIFFDSDDLFTPEFAALWHDLRGQDFDFCLMRYQDSERGFFGGLGQNPYDESCWNRAALGQDLLREVTAPALWALAEAGNFPWNKIYRTGFLRANDIRCTETMVHNDIELHWRSFLAAKRVLVSPRICAQHIVRPGADRLTNVSGAARLQMFTAFDRVVTALWQGHETPAAQQAFVRFASGLMAWGRQIIAPDLRPAFQSATRQFLRATLTPPLYETLVQTDPVLALELCLHMADAPGQTPC